MSTHERILYGWDESGHSHRAQLLLEMLELDYRYESTPPDARRTAGFLALNPLGQVPVLVDGPSVVADSNAILVYLALAYDPSRRWLPANPFAAAQVQRWLSIAAGEVRFGPATARAIAQWNAPGDPAQAAAISRRLLGFMDSHLGGRQWLTADHATIADLANYAYVAHAPEGGVVVRRFANVTAWVERVQALPRFVPMKARPLPA